MSGSRFAYLWFLIRRRIMIRGWIIIRYESKSSRIKMKKIKIKLQIKMNKNPNELWIKVNQKESMRFVRFESESKWIRIKKWFAQGNHKSRKDFDPRRESKWIALVRALNYIIIYSHTFLILMTIICKLISMHIK